MLTALIRVYFLLCTSDLQGNIGSVGTIKKGAQPVARFRHKPGEQTEIADTGAVTKDFVIKAEMPTGATAPVGNIYTAKNKKLRPLCSRSFWLP